MLSHYIKISFLRTCFQVFKYFVNVNLHNFRSRTVNKNLLKFLFTFVIYMENTSTKIRSIKYLHTVNGDEKLTCF